jgi:hypothetical protein
VEHEDELFDFEADMERIFDDLAEQMMVVDEDLTFEFGPKETKREFIISAGGAVASFPAVVSLFKAAPKLQRWEVIAFRPRKSPEYWSIDLGERSQSLEDVEFSLLENGESIGLKLFVRGYQEKDFSLAEITYLLLDVVLGEFDTGSLGMVKFYPLDELSTERRYSLKDLPELFDSLNARLKGVSGKPH